MMSCMGVNRVIRHDMGVIQYGVSGVNVISPDMHMINIKVM